MNRTSSLKRLAAELALQQADMVRALDALVSSESPSDAPALLSTTADVVAGVGAGLIGKPPERLAMPGGPGLRWQVGGVRRHTAPVLLLAHYDTVWPAGTIDRWPFTVTGDRATGPGAFDMKAGLVQAMFALAALQAVDLPHPPVVLLVTSDEEIGSPAGRALVESEARGAAAALVLEASADGALKTARKGVGTYALSVTGRAAHAGLEPEKGVNAVIAAAHLVLAVAELVDVDLGTTVTPTMMTAGTAQNTVPASAHVTIDVRAFTAREQERVDRGLRSVRAPNGAAVVLEGGINRPPMEEQRSGELFELAQRAATRCDLPPLASARVGGGSDGNFTAAMGVRTLDGLGAVGAGAHAEGEYVLTSAMPERAALLAGLIVELGEEQR